MTTTIEANLGKIGLKTIATKLPQGDKYESMGGGYYNFIISNPSDVDSFTDYLDEISVEWRLV